MMKDRKRFGTLLLAIGLCAVMAVSFAFIAAEAEYQAAAHAGAGPAGADGFLFPAARTGGPLPAGTAEPFFPRYACKLEGPA